MGTNEVIDHLRESLKEAGLDRIDGFVDHVGENLGKCLTVVSSIWSNKDKKSFLKKFYGNEWIIQKGVKRAYKQLAVHTLNISEKSLSKWSQDDEAIKQEYEKLDHTVQFRLYQTKPVDKVDENGISTEEIVQKDRQYLLYIGNDSEGGILKTFGNFILTVTKDGEFIVNSGYLGENKVRGHGYGLAALNFIIGFFEMVKEPLGIKGGIQISGGNLEYINFYLKNGFVCKTQEDQDRLNDIIANQDDYCTGSIKASDGNGIMPKYVDGFIFKKHAKPVDYIEENDRHVYDDKDTIRVNLVLK